MHSARLFQTAVRAELATVEIPEALCPGEDHTLALSGPAPRVTAILMYDRTSAPPTGMAKIRVVHAARDAPAVDVATTGGAPLFMDLRFGQGTMFREATAGPFSLELRPRRQMAPISTVPDMTIEAGTGYTMAAIGLLRGAPGLKMIAIADVVPVAV